MKKILLILALIFIATACSTVDTAETNETQMKRLLKEADKKEKETEKKRMEESKKMEKEVSMMEAKETESQAGTEMKEENAEMMEEAKKEKWADPHKDKTRGEIMQYEMERVRAEMEALQSSVNDYAQKTKMLKEYKEKLEKLEKLNQASMQ